MIEDIPQVSVDERIFRLTLLKDDDLTLQGHDLTAAQRNQARDLLATPRETVEQSLDEPFNAWAGASTPFRPHTRYSTGEWPVFYAALDWQTARDEIMYHNRRHAISTENNVVWWKHLIQCQLRGRAKDLRPSLATWPDLTSDDYAFCQEIGKEAHVVLDALLCPSARRTDGTTVPVFKRPALSEPVLLARVKFTYDPSTDAVDVEPHEIRGSQTLDEN